MSLEKYKPCDLANDFIVDTKALSWISEGKRFNLSQELGQADLFVNNLDLFNKRVDRDVMTEKELEDIKKLSLLIAEQGNVNTQKNKLILFTGANQTDAENYVAMFREYDVIHSRPGGAMLEMLNLFDENLNLTRDERYAPWNILAKRLCQEASGNVRAIVENPPPKLTSTFLTIELPEMMDVEKITTINAIDKHEFNKKLQLKLK